MNSWLNLAASNEATEIIGKIKTTILNPLITLGFGIALLVFLWGAVESLRQGRSGEGRKTGSQHMLWGIFGLFIMVSAFGILSLICNTINCQ